MTDSERPAFSRLLTELAAATRGSPRDERLRAALDAYWQALAPLPWPAVERTLQSAIAESPTWPTASEVREAAQAEAKMAGAPRPRLELSRAGAASKRGKDLHDAGRPFVFIPDTREDGTPDPDHSWPIEVRPALLRRYAHVCARGDEWSNRVHTLRGLSAPPCITAYSGISTHCTDAQVATCARAILADAGGPKIPVAK